MACKRGQWVEINGPDSDYYATEFWITLDIYRTNMFIDVSLDYFCIVNYVDMVEWHTLVVLLFLEVNIV